MNRDFVVRGGPSDAELAALTAVLLALRGATASEHPPRPSGSWRSRRRALRLRPVPGLGAWRAAARY